MTRSRNGWLIGLVVGGAVAMTRASAAADDRVAEHPEQACIPPEEHAGGLTATPGGEAIRAKRLAISGSPLGVEYFCTALGSIREVGDVGMVRYFTGSKGSGAIFWAAPFGAHAVYGEILEAFSSKGGVEKLGYPLSDPVSGPGDGCPTADVTKRQYFARIPSAATRAVSTTMETLCLTPTGVYQSVQL